MTTTVGTLTATASANSARNKVRHEDRAVHDWYRFVLSFPPHLVQTYVDRFGLDTSNTVLDPFCGTGTTLVECKKLGIASVGLEPNPMAHFATAVKIDWKVEPSELETYARAVAGSAQRMVEQGDVDQWAGLPLLAGNGDSQARLRGLAPEQARLLLKNSISPLPLHKTLVLLEAIHGHGNQHLQRCGRLALATALVRRIGNLRFGPEVGIGQIKEDAPVIATWAEGMRSMANDLRCVEGRSGVHARAIKADARQADQVLAPESIDAVITSPPYPNEKDYTRTTRLESVILGLVRDRQELRSLKQNLVRSNTRGVYKADTDDRAVAEHTVIRDIAERIEQRRIELGKTSGFERLYPRVTQLYFGGMARHLASLRPVLRPGARLAYVVGDQASYLRIMIRTGQILADLAQSLGYRVMGIDLFRTRPSTVTGDQLREEVVLLEWPGN
jgi:DNA modification methylase